MSVSRTIAAARSHALSPPERAKTARLPASGADLSYSASSPLIPIAAATPKNEATGRDSSAAAERGAGSQQTGPFGERQRRASRKARHGPRGPREVHPRADRGKRDAGLEDEKHMKRVLKRVRGVAASLDGGGGQRGYREGTGGRGRPFRPRATCPSRRRPSLHICALAPGAGMPLAPLCPARAAFPPPRAFWSPGGLQRPRGVPQKCALKRGPKFTIGIPV